MSNYLNFQANPWAAIAQDKGKSYVIGQHTRPDPNAAPPQSDPATGRMLSPMVLITTFRVDVIAGAMTTSLGDFPTLQAAQAAAQADANS